MLRVNATLVASDNNNNRQSMSMLLDKWDTLGLSREELLDLEAKTKKLLGEVKLHKMLLNK